MQSVKNPRGQGRGNSGGNPNGNTRNISSANTRGNSTGNRRGRRSPQPNVVENKAEVKVEIKVENKTKNKAENKPDNKALNNTENKAVNKTENKVVNKTENKAVTKTEIKVLNRTENKPVNKAENKQVKKANNKPVDKSVTKGMANLNFQQAPRSLASGGVGGRVGSGLVTGVTGHVTPTYGGALSPGRGSTAMPGGAPPSMASRSTLFGQRAFADRRVPMPTPLSGQPNSNAMMFRQSGISNLSRFNTGSNYHSVFGEGGDTSTPPLLDLSEFPSLTARGAGDQAPTAAPPPPGSKPYVGMVKQPTSEQSEFTMSSEDFPALPGTSNTSGSTPAQPPAAAPSSAHGQDYSHSAEKPRKGIQTSPDGNVTNIPTTMIPNQFGIVGLLTFIRAAESDPSLVSLALGQDLTALGLNLNSPDNLYLTFAGPWADTPCRPQDMDYHVPPEYLINGSIRDKLAPVRLSRYKEDLLFYLFYCYVGDVLQIAAAAELYNREWRYHMEEKVWISQAPGMPMVEKTSTYERGTYYFFDAHNWRKVAKEFHLDYSKLEGRPQLPPHVLT